MKGHRGVTMHRIARGMAVAACICLLAACSARQTNVANAPDMPAEPAFVQEGLAGGYGALGSSAGIEVRETDDKRALTAVHRTLPLGISVKVRNIENNREAVVLIAGRGPLARGRIIDLSYAASAALGIGEKSTVPVRIEALGFRTEDAVKEAYRRPSSYDAGAFTIQVGMFVKEQNPSRIRDILQERTGHVEVRETRMQGLLLYRILAGTYASLSDAEAAAKDLSLHGYPASIVFSLK